MKKYIVCCVVMVLFLFSCGKKLPPTSPDRWPPRVLDVQSVDRYHLRVFFSERLDSLTPRKLVNYGIVKHGDAETTSVIYAEREKKGDEVLITIPLLEEEEYSLLIYRIKDLKGNMMEFAEKKFTPSMAPDTVAPLLKATSPSRTLTSAPVESTIVLTFTEPMDTISATPAHFMQTNLMIDSVFAWNKTLTEMTLHYKLEENTMAKLFILPKIPDLSGNPLDDMRILGLTTNDTIPRNRLNIDIAAADSSLINICGFLTRHKDGALHDIVWADTTLSFTIYFATPDTYSVGVVGEHKEDTTGMWWGEKEIAFYPDTTRSMVDTVAVSFVKRDVLPERLFSLYELIKKHGEEKRK